MMHPPEVEFRVDGKAHAFRVPAVYPIAGDIVFLKTGRFRVIQRVIDYSKSEMQPEAVVIYLERAPLEATPT